MCSHAAPHGSVSDDVAGAEDDVEKVEAQGGSVLAAQLGDLPPCVAVVTGRQWQLEVEQPT